MVYMNFVTLPFGCKIVTLDFSTGSHMRILRHVEGDGDFPFYFDLSHSQKQKKKIITRRKIYSQTTE